MRLFIIAIILLFAVSTYGQSQKEIDSLQQELKNNDISKLDQAKLNYNIAREYFDHDRKKTILYLEKAEALLKQQDVINDNIYSKIFIAKGRIVGQLNDYKASDSIYQLAEQYANKLSGSDRFYYVTDAQEGIALNYFFKGDLDKALALYNKLEKRTKTIDTTIFVNRKLKNLIYENKAIVLATQGDLNKALDYFTISANFHRNEYKSNKILIPNYVNALNNIALCYNLLQKHDKAIKAYIEGLKVAKENGLKNSINLIIANLGNLFILANNNEKSIEYSKQVINDSTPAVFSAYNNLGNAYANLKQFDKSITLHNKALKIALIVDRPLKTAKSHINLAINYAILNKSDSALIHIKKAERILHQKPNKDIENMLDEAQGKYLFYQRSYKKALPHLLKFMNYNQKNGNLSERYFRSVNNIYEAYKQLNKNDKALVWIEKRDSVRHKLDSIYLKNKLYDIETKYQTQQKEAEILKLSNENLKKKTELSKTKTTVTIVSSILLLFLGISLFYWYKRKQKEKLIKLESAVQATEEEKQRIGKELHDSIAGNLIRLVHEVEDENIALSDKLLKTYNEVRDLSHQLNNTPSHGEIFLERLIEIIPDNKNNQVFSFKITPTNLQLIEPYDTHIYRIVQELITNNLKHAEATKTDINIIYKDETISLSYKDNGKGATSINKGIGLKNIEDRVTLMQGKITVNATNGFFVTITIPYKNKR